MLAKKTSKNQITLPNRIADQFPGVEYFEVTKDGDRIVLEPVRAGLVDEVRERLESVGITQKDVEDAVAWARRRD